jgi:adenylate cyclase
VSPAAWIALALGLLLVAAVAALVRARTEVFALRERVAELEQLAERVTVTEARNPRAVQAAGMAVRTAADAVSRLRSQGMRGMLLSSIEDLTDWALAERSEIVRVADEDGNVTLFFSDIESSTALNSELGDAAWVKVLEAHEQLVRTHVGQHGGHVVKSNGDGFMVVFPTPEHGLGAATDVQRALTAKRQRNRRLRDHPIRVRIGLHTGKAIERDGDWFGRNVAKAARVAAMADGGEILVSTELAARLRERGGRDLPWSLRRTETVELKGLPGDHTLWVVEEPDDQSR